MSESNAANRAVKLSFDFDREDWLRHARSVLNDSPGIRRQKKVIRFLFPAALALLAFVYAQESPGDQWIVYSIVAVFAVPVLLFYPRFYDRQAVAAAERMMKEENMRDVYGHREVVLSADGIRSSSTAGEHFYKSAGIARVRETPHALMIYVTTGQVMTLPRKKIPPEEFEKAAAFAKEHYGASTVPQAIGNNPP